MQINKLKLKFVTLSQQPIIQLNYLMNQSTIKPKKIEISIYKAVDDVLQTSQLINQTSQISDSFESIYQQYKTNHSVYTDSVISTLKSIWAALTSSGKIIKQLQRKSENLQYTFTPPNETADARLVINDLQIKFKEYGDYQLLFSVDGIEAKLTQVISITAGIDQDFVSRREVIEDFYFQVFEFYIRF